MLNEMSLAELDDAIERLDQVIPGAFSPVDSMRHYVVFASNQTLPYTMSPYNARNEDLTLCGYKNLYGPARGAVPTCMECICIMDQLQNMDTRR